MTLYQPVIGDGSQQTKVASVVVFGATWSENTGDGVIADCVAWALSRDIPGTEIRHVDIAGRRGPGMVTVNNRATILQVLTWLPALTRLVFMRAGLRRLVKRIAMHWRDEIARADLVLVSGGQIFSDVHRNFPYKIEAMARISRDEGVPVAIAAAGVSLNWSAEGRRLFLALADCDLRFVGLRDPASIAAWQSHFGAGPSPVLVRDPGLLAVDCYNLRAIAPAQNAPIDLGVAAFMILAHHADRAIAGAGQPPSAAGLREFFVNIVRELVARGNRVRLFCNGAAEDAALLRAIMGHPAVMALVDDGTVDAADSPRTGAELARIIAGCRAVIAHRLHACVVAYSCTVPALGLGWDSKLDAFFESVGLAAHIITDPVVLPSTVVERAHAALADGIAADKHDSILQDANRGLRQVWAAVGLTDTIKKELQ